MSASSAPEPTAELSGCCVLFAGRLGGMPRREAQRLVRQHAGNVSDRFDPSVNLIVVGEHDLPLDDAGGLWELLDAQARRSVEAGDVQLLSETQFWQRLGLLEACQQVHRLYTPGMLANLLGVPVEVIRRWHRRGLIRPAGEVHRLPYFDFQEVTTARRLAELMAAGASPRTIEQNLASLARLLPGVERPLAQLSVLIEGRQLLLRHDHGLVEPSGQRRFDFDSESPSESPLAAQSGSMDEAATGDDLRAADAFAGDAEAELHQPGGSTSAPAATVDECLQAAIDLEESGDLNAAVTAYRAALAVGGPDARSCFYLGELLYRLGDGAGARERYYVAIELDDEFAKARASLGCLLAEQGDITLALAALEGALRCHPDYPDAHYHLARLLDEADRLDEADQHWRAFLELAADSPWADEARERLQVP